MIRRAQNPYVCRKEYEENRFFYEFETDQKVRYRAYFSDYSYMFGTHELECNLYSFDLDVVGSNRPPKYTAVDYRIADTVCWCFIEVFQSISNVIVAVYDSTDKGEYARKRKFESWFNGAGINYIERVDFELNEDYNLLSAIYIHVDLMIKEEVINRYQMVLENGNIPLD